MISFSYFGYDEVRCPLIYCSYTSVYAVEHAVCVYWVRVFGVVFKLNNDLSVHCDVVVVNYYL